MDDGADDEAGGNDDDIAAAHGTDDGVQTGIKTGDVIVEFDGKEVSTIDDINEIKNAHKVGDTIKVKYVREGKKKETELTLLEEKPQTEQKPTNSNQQQTPTIPQLPSDFFNWFGW